MKKFAACLAAAALVLGISWPTPAAADEYGYHAELVCRPGSNVALIRFGISDDDGPPVFRRLPAGIDGGLSATGRTRRTDCNLGNGWPIRIRAGVEQAFAYGEGGADPPAFFSLWIGRHRILSRREWKAGYGEGDARPPLVAVVIRPTGLTFCAARETERPACRREPLRLAGRPIDRIEYPASGRRPQTGSLSYQRGSASPALCRFYLDRLRRDRFEWDHPERATSNRFGFDIPERAVRGYSHALWWGPIDIAPGQRRRMAIWLSGTHFFDGEVALFAPLEADMRPIVTPAIVEDPSDLPAMRLPRGWTILSGSLPWLYPGVSARYVHLAPQRIRGRLYFLAWPTNSDERPTAILAQPLPGGGGRAACIIQRVEPHF